MSMSLAAVAMLTYRLYDLEAEATSLMAQQMNIRDSQSFIEDSKAAAENDFNTSYVMGEPSDKDSKYYYKKSTFTVGDKKYTIDSRSNSNYGTVKDGTFNVTVKKTGKTLNQYGHGLKVTQGGEFTGHTININDKTYSKPESGGTGNGYIGTVNVIDPTKYWVEKPQSEWENADLNLDGKIDEDEYDPASRYRKGEPSDKIADLIDPKTEKPLSITNAYTIQELTDKNVGAVTVSGDGYRVNTTGLAEGNNTVFVPESAGFKPDGAIAYNETNSGQQALNSAIAAGNLYVIDSKADGKTYCRQVKDISELSSLSGKTLVEKTNDATYNGINTYTDIEAKSEDMGLKVGGNSPMTFENAEQSEEDIPVQDLIEAALNYCSRSKLDEYGNSAIDEQWIRNHYQIVKVGDNNWGLVSTAELSSAAKDSSSVSVFTAGDGEYDAPDGNLNVHDIIYDNNGDIKTLQVGEDNTPLNVTNEKIFDEIAYEKDLQDYRIAKQTLNSDVSEFEKQLRQLKNEGADIEVKLQQIATERKIVQGFLDSEKQINKEWAERLSKSWSS